MYDSYSLVPSNSFCVNKFPSNKMSDTCDCAKTTLTLSLKVKQFSSNRRVFNRVQSLSSVGMSESRFLFAFSSTIFKFPMLDGRDCSLLLLDSRASRCLHWLIESGRVSMLLLVMLRVLRFFS